MDEKVGRIEGIVSEEMSMKRLVRPRPTARGHPVDLMVGPSDMRRGGIGGIRPWRP